MLDFRMVTADHVSVCGAKWMRHSLLYMCSNPCLHGWRDQKTVGAGKLGVPDCVKARIRIRGGQYRGTAVQAPKSVFSTSKVYPRTNVSFNRRMDSHWQEQVGRYKSRQVSPSARRRAQCKGGGGKKNTYTKNCTTYRRLSKNVVATFIWSTNLGDMEANHPIEPHFSQHFPNCSKLCPCKTFVI